MNAEWPLWYVLVLPSVQALNLVALPQAVVVEEVAAGVLAPVDGAAAQFQEGARYVGNLLGAGLVKDPQGEVPVL